MVPFLHLHFKARPLSAPCLRIPGTSRLWFDLRIATPGGRIWNSNHLFTTRALDLATGVLGVAFEWLIAMRTEKLEFSGIHNLTQSCATGTGKVWKGKIFL